MLAAALESPSDELMGRSLSHRDATKCATVVASTVTIAAQFSSMVVRSNRKCRLCLVRDSSLLITHTVWHLRQMSYVMPNRFA